MEQLSKQITVYKYINFTLMNTYVIVRFQVEGIHFWPDAKTKLPEVAYLSLPHRHVFHIEAYKPVTHDDRDVEIIMFKRELADYFKRNYWDEPLRLCNFGARSCETIAKDLVEAYDLFIVEVLEDGENGACVTNPNVKR